MFLTIIFFTFLIALCCLIAALLLLLRKDFLGKVVLYLVALSAGVLMGAAFFHLLPEALSNLPVKNVTLIVVGAFLFFFLVEKVFHFQHCHKEKCEVHSFGYVNLLGDAVHNFIDGIIIAGAFLTNFGLGVGATLAIALHEIPQEVGDLGVLIHAGFAKKKALLFNFATALSVVLGGAIGYFVSSFANNIVPYLLPFALGGFLYIACSDLIPELRQEQSIKKSVWHFVVFIIGIALMFFLVD